MDSWYAEMKERYGEEYCRIAGYFDETKPFTKMYGEVFDLPKDKFVIQFSGAFHPFHEGHLSIVKTVLDALDDREEVTIVIHADHAEYRHSKGEYDEAAFLASFDILNTLPGRWGRGQRPWMLVREDLMPDGCSRNFTRLYSELRARNDGVIFLSGGDRANYALTFRDRGKCIIAGRDQSEMYKRYSFLSRDLELGANITFLPGNNPMSSTEVRNAHDRHR